METPIVANHLLHILKPHFDKEVQNGHTRLESLYRQGERDGTELSLILAEIIAIKNFQIKLEKMTAAANRAVADEVNKNAIP